MEEVLEKEAKYWRTTPTPVSLMDRSEKVVVQKLQEVESGEGEEEF